MTDGDEFLGIFISLYTACGLGFLANLYVFVKEYRQCPKEAPCTKFVKSQTVFYMAFFISSLCFAIVT